MELWAMEGLHISFPSNQTQPDVVEPEHLEKIVSKEFVEGISKKKY